MAHGQSRPTTSPVAQHVRESFSDIRDGSYSGDRVGTGYFSVELARRVRAGRLELFDLQPEMLAKAKRKLVKEGIENVGYMIGDASARLPFPDAHFDIAVLVTVLREVSDKEACLSEINRVLRPAGVVVFHEQLPDNLIRFAELGPMVENAGFVHESRYGPSWNYTATYRKPLVPSVRLQGATAHAYSYVMPRV